MKIDRAMEILRLKKEMDVIREQIDLLINSPGRTFKAVEMCKQFAEGGWTEERVKEMLEVEKRIDDLREKFYEIKIKIDPHGSRFYENIHDAQLVVETVEELQSRGPTKAG